MRTEIIGVRLTPAEVKALDRMVRDKQRTTDGTVTRSTVLRALLAEAKKDK
jgi:hypothetical protein